MSSAVDMVLDLREAIGKDKADWCTCLGGTSFKCRSCRYIEKLQVELVDIIQKLQDLADDEAQVMDDLRDYHEGEMSEQRQTLVIDCLCGTIHDD